MFKGKRRHWTRPFFTCVCVCVYLRIVSYLIGKLFHYEYHSQKAFISLNIPLGGLIWISKTSASLPCYFPVRHFNVLWGKDISVLIRNYYCEICAPFEIANELLNLKMDWKLSFVDYIMSSILCLVG